MTASEASPPPVRVLVVDNDEDLAAAMSETLERIGCSCATATSGPEGADFLDREEFDVVVTDLVMNDVDGMAILEKAKRLLPDAEVILVTGHASVPKAVDAMRLGAYNFLEKPVSPSRLRAIAEKAADSVRLKQANVDLHRRLDERFGFEGIIYASDAMRRVIERLKRVAPTDASVLITGANGTGKELVAQAIHQNSPRKKKPFVAFNCAALPENLLESELFGHTRGAYTDALTDRVGRFEYANGGTLFLDEVGDMPMSIQVKLLRVLEQREITKLGENKPIPVNVRILSATNRDLEDAIRDGTFRSDLYYRLKVVTIDLPPLRDRREDILPLVDYFRKQMAERHGKRIRGATSGLIRQLYAFDWPGNIRQLRNAVESMVVFDTDEILDVDDLPPEMVDEEVAASGEPAETPLPTGDLLGPAHLIGQPMSEIERWAIEETLKFVGGNREEAARRLGIGARTLYRKIKDYGL